MSKTLIRTPFPSSAQVAEKLGLSASRARHIENLVDAIIGETRISKRPGRNGNNILSVKTKPAPKKQK
jgi:hypothetical protein